MARFGLALLLTGFVFSPAYASFCNKKIVAEIHISEGDRCWTYHGKATIGQSVDVRMYGESNDHPPTTWESREATVNGPSEFTAAPDDENSDTLTFMAPMSGAYEISFLPCVMWGGDGVVHICVK